MSESTLKYTAFWEKRQNGRILSDHLFQITYYCFGLQGLPYQPSQSTPYIQYETLKQALILANATYSNN